MVNKQKFTFADDTPVKGSSRMLRRNRRSSSNSKGTPSGSDSNSGGTGTISNSSSPETSATNNSSSGKKTKSSGGINASLGAKLERHFGNEAVRQHQQEVRRPEKDAQSLTYSASSSVAGESTDSSFADIMKVLDINDSAEIATLMAKEGITDMTVQEYVQRAQAKAASAAAAKRGGRSV